ncbi:MAG: redoxin family protein [Pseudomonadota bacterium]
MKNLNHFLSVFFLLIIFNTANAASLKDGITPYPAPEIAGIDKWINSKELKISDLKGKVVLIDFWTYSCINCLRTLPHLIELQKKYSSKGFVIIGIHSPEFDFEKDQKNVELAVERFKIEYPVALDNNLKTWDNYKNHYWPAHYLINKEGKVVYTHFGEGKYEDMENNIAALLGINLIKSDRIADKKISNQIVTPETYLGLERGENNYNKSANLTFPKLLPNHGWALQGDWKNFQQFIESKKDGDALRLNFTARKVFLVMAGANGKTVKASVYFNGAKISSGVDVKDGIVTVSDSRLYELLNLPKIRNGLLEIKADGPGLQAYAFTFEE